MSLWLVPEVTLIFCHFYHFGFTQKFKMDKSGFCLSILYQLWYFHEWYMMYLKFEIDRYFLLKKYCVKWRGGTKTKATKKTLNFCSRLHLFLKKRYSHAQMQMVLTLPLPSLLVPTPFTKGGGGGRPDPLLSQKPFPPWTWNFVGYYRHL